MTALSGVPLSLFVEGRPVVRRWRQPTAAGAIDTGGFSAIYLASANGLGHWYFLTRCGLPVATPRAKADRI